MKRLLSPTLQISLGLLSLTLSLILIAYAIGLIPNEDKAALEVRARISENLAIQLASLAGRNDAGAINDTIAAVIGRNRDVLSIAIRGADGKVLVASEGHTSQWTPPADGKSTATHIRVPLLNADAPGGTIEIAFRPPVTATNILGFSRTLVGLVGFMVVAGFPGFYFVLRRALRELDPSRAIPERVKAAFDTLAEGVLIMDEREYIVLANDAFVRNIYSGESGEALLGMNVNELPWLPSDHASMAAEFPWQTALHHADPVLGRPMRLSRQSGDNRRLLVNSTRIVDGQGVVRGLIATFYDVTMLHETNEQLKLSIEQLNISQHRISEQNQQLKILAASDPLTGCLNRRSFFAEAELALRRASDQRQYMSLLMLDVDHFKSINDRFGHGVGDEVLVGLVDVLCRTCRASDLIGRYGGEEFCIMVVGLAEKDVERLAERIRLAVADVTTWLPDHRRVTTSIGIASLGGGRSAIADLVRRADEALYAAKTAGRNRVVSWSTMPMQAEAPSLVPQQPGTELAHGGDASVL
jgi:diguanylate cyclase (GGDEF)-like protein/PAS domain S-box-containing protein